MLQIKEREIQRRITRDVGQGEVLTAMARLEHIRGNKSHHFSVTAELRTYGRMTSCGMMHEEIEKHMPEFRPLLKWHLNAVNHGPMHYVENALYWAGFRNAEKANYEHLASTIVFGSADGDADVNLERLARSMKEIEFTGWLTERFPSLNAAFEKDMLALFGEDIEITNGEDHA